ncbi:copia protein [Tanacetum coccineum]
MGQDSAHMVATSKVPMLKPVIENINTAPKITVVEGVEKVMPPTTAEETAQKRLEVKAKSTLMMGIPNEHQLKFNLIKDAKLYENFTAPSSEMLDQTFDRLKKLVSQLELLGEMISQEDMSQKLLRSLSPEWNTHVVVWRNKTDLYTMSMDDLLTNKLRCMDQSPKGMSSSSSSTQNMAFVSSSNNNNSSINGVVSTAQVVNIANEVFAINTQVNASNIDNLSDAVICMMLTINGNESIGFDSPKLECYILPQKRTFANQCISDQAEEGPNYALMAYSSSSSDSEETSCTPHLNFIFTGLDEFVNKPIVENIKSDEEVSKVVRKSNDSLIIEDWVLDSEEENLSQTKTEKKTKIDTIVAFGGNPKEGNHRKRIPLKLKQKPRKPKRKDTQIPQSSGPTEHVADEVVHKERGDSLVRAATTASSLEAEQDSGNINKTRSKATLNEPSSLGTSSGSGPRCQETIGDTIAQTRFENVSKLSNDPLLARGNTLQSGEDSLELNELMELYVEKKDISRTHKLKRLYKVGLSARVESSGDEEDLGEDASKQGRINDIDADEDITLVNDQDDADMFDVNTLTGDEVLVKPEIVVRDVNLTVDEITLAQALADLKSVKPKVKANVVEEPSVPISAANTKVSAATTTTMLQFYSIGKELSLLSWVHLPQDKGNRIMIKEPMVEQVKPMKGLEQMEVNIAWDDVQAKVEANYQLAQRLQAQKKEELTDEEKARLFIQFLEQRRKHFAAKRADDKRNRPPTRAQQRNIMNELVEESSKKVETKLEDNLKKAEAEVMEGSSKRAGEELEQENEEEVVVDAMTLATKPSSNVDWKIHKEGKNSYYQIIRVDGSSKMYRIFSQMLKVLTEKIWKLYLKTMFEPHVEDQVWKNQQDYKVLDWKLYDSCGVLSLRMQHGRIVGIKRLLDDLRVSAALVCVTVAKLKLRKDKDRRKDKDCLKIKITYVFQSSTCISSGLPSTNTMYHIDSISTTKEEALSFIRELGHSREIKCITDVIVDHLHQPWRTFASIINKCICGKELAYQIDNKDSKKQDKMFYPRFTKIIIHYFLKKEAYQAKKDVPLTKKPSTNPKPTRKKALVKADRGKRLNVLSEVALSEAAQLKEISVDSGEEDDEDDNEDDEGNDDGDDSDVNDDDDDDDSQFNEEHKEEEEENVDEFTNKEDDEEELDDGEELYKDVNVNLRKEEVEMTDDDQSGADQHNKTKGPIQSSSVSSYFIEKLLNFENVSPSDNEIASLMDTTVHHEEPSGQTSTLFTVPITVIPTTIPPPPHFFNPLPQQATPTPTPTTSEATTSFPALPDFSSIFKFNDIVTKLETDLSEMKQDDQYAQAISSIPAIVDRYINNKLGEAIHKAIQEEVKTQLPHILPKAVSDFATPVTERNVTELLEAVVLTKSSSQPKSTYKVAASLSEYELMKILLDKMEERKSHLRADYKRKLYDALVNSYNTDKDLFNTYGEVFTLKRSQDDKEKDKDPSTGSVQRTKRRKSSKEAELQKIKEERSHAVDDSGVQKNQEFGTGNNDEQLDDEAASKNNWFKKPERPPTPDPDWNKRQCVDFRPTQTWISVTARAEKPLTSFDELIDTPIDFSAFVMNRLNIANLTQELLVGPAVNLLKGTCKSLTKLEYHFEKCSKATTERLDWHNPKGKLYPFDLRKPFPLILDHRGRQVIPQDYFINNDLEYLKGGSLSRQYSTSVTKTKAATYEIKWIEDMVPNLWSPIKVIMKWYDYSHLDEIEIRREDQQLYTFKEGDFPRLRLQDIEDMLLLLVQQRLTNLTVDECYDLNVALRMFTKRIVIQRWVEDLQLGVESYQKKLNITKPDTFKSNLRNRTAYTAYSDPQGVIYKESNINRLMRTDELHKFSDGTLNDVRTALHDIASGIRMEYLPNRKWSGLDK